MEIAALVILILCSIIGFAAIFFTTFGTLIILIGAIAYALLTKFSIFTVKTLIILLGLYVFGEIVEYISIVAGAKKFGASNAAIVGALVGSIIGAAAGAGFFGIGVIFGAFFGMFLGAFLVELFLRRDVVKSLKAGTGGIVGRLGSIAAKVIVAIVMFIIMATAIVNADGALKDGRFIGKSSIVDVAVTVEGGLIAAVQILENRGGETYPEKVRPLIDEIIKKQSTDVDAITGATVTSEGIKSAVSEALKQAEE